MINQYGLEKIIRMAKGERPLLRDFWFAIDPMQRTGDFYVYRFYVSGLQGKFTDIYTLSATQADSMSPGELYDRMAAAFDRFLCGIEQRLDNVKQLASCENLKRLLEGMI